MYFNRSISVVYTDKFGERETWILRKRSWLQFLRWWLIWCQAPLRHWYFRPFVNTLHLSNIYVFCLASCSYFAWPSLYLIIYVVVENYNVTIVERGNHLIYLKYESLECLQNIKIHQWLFSTYIYIFVWKLNQTVLELDFRAVKFLLFPRRDLNPHHWYTAAPFA